MWNFGRPITSSISSNISFDINNSSLPAMTLVYVLLGNPVLCGQRFPVGKNACPFVFPFIDPYSETWQNNIMKRLCSLTNARPDTRE